VHHPSADWGIQVSTEPHPTTAASKCGVVYLFPTLVGHFHLQLTLHGLVEAEAIGGTLRLHPRVYVARGRVWIGLCGVPGASL